MNGLRSILLGFVFFGACTFAEAQAAESSPVLENPATAGVAAKSMGAFNGTLFFTPQQRREMDRDRKRRLTGAPAAQAEDTRSVINGVATRSDGKLTVWVDGLPRWESANSRYLSGLSAADVGAASGYLSPAGSGESAAASPNVTRKKSAKRPAKKLKK